MFHVALTNFQANIGDAVLTYATRMAFNYFLGAPAQHGSAPPTDAERESNWLRVDAHSESEKTTNSFLRLVNKVDEHHEPNVVGVLVGGGGLFYHANRFSRQTVSGWQWQVPESGITGTRPPMMLFAIGWNSFREDSTTPAAQDDAFNRSLLALGRADAFIGLRESYSLDAIRARLDGLGEAGRSVALHYQPCATTLLGILKPCLASTILLDDPQVVTVRPSHAPHMPHTCPGHTIPFATLRPCSERTKVC
jgi:hypothetical protein